VRTVEIAQVANKWPRPLSIQIPYKVKIGVPTVFASFCTHALLTIGGKLLLRVD
jgi:hypothetical protein